MLDGQFLQTEYYGGQIHTWRTYDSLSFYMQFLFTRMYIEAAVDAILITS
jgi:hypothetical protein